MPQEEKTATPEKGKGKAVETPEKKDDKAQNGDGKKDKKDEAAKEGTSSELPLE